MARVDRYGLPDVASLRTPDEIVGELPEVDPCHIDGSVDLSMMPVGMLAATGRKDRRAEGGAVARALATSPVALPVTPSTPAVIRAA